MQSQNKDHSEHSNSTKVMAALVMGHTSIQHATFTKRGLLCSGPVVVSFTLANCPLSSEGYIHSFQKFLVKGWEVQPCGKY